MKKIAVLVILLVFGFSGQAQDNKEWTLTECVEYALENNISIKQSQLDVEVTDTEKLQAIGNFVPTLNGNASYSTNTGAN
ncbi:MAG TPA: transporter, partial [Flavobacteriaceae bacterium]|nr:transporter [Flavobacteriaceae bacterium]